jgi:hypothetical protein
VRRTLALWLLLFGAYAATLGLDAFRDSDYGADEARYLLAAESLLDDGDVDVKDEYEARAYRGFHPYELERRGQETEGRLNEPHGVGFPLLILPAYAAGGPQGVELFLAALAALASALAYRLALRVVPDPWALGAAAVAGLSAPFLAYGTAVHPELSAGAALAGAALLALRLDERPSRRAAFGCFALLGTVPWLGVEFALPALVIGAFAARTLWRARRRTLAVGAVELSLFGVALMIGINEALYGGPTPYSAEAAQGDAAAGTSGAGRLQWAPAFALVFAGLWWMWRSVRERLSQAVPGVRRIELTAGLCAAALAAQLVAALLASAVDDSGFEGRHLVAALPLAVPLMAWGLRHTPRLGIALSVLTLAMSVWLYADVRWGGGSLADW